MNLTAYARHRILKKMINYVTPSPYCTTTVVALVVSYIFLRAAQTNTRASGIFYFPRRGEVVLFPHRIFRHVCSSEMFFSCPYTAEQLRFVSTDLMIASKTSTYGVVCYLRIISVSAQKAVYRSVNGPLYKANIYFWIPAAAGIFDDIVRHIVVVERCVSDGLSKLL